MVSQIMLNILMAMTWELIFPAWTLSAFIVGYILGAIILYFFYYQDRQNFYLIKIMKGLILALTLLKEMIVSSINVLKYVCLPLSHLKAGIIRMDIDFQHDMELVLLANMITLTPGTLTLEISPDNRTIYIHALDCSDPEQLIKNIRDTFERPIKEVAEANGS